VKFEKVSLFGSGCDGLSDLQQQHESMGKISLLTNAYKQLSII
jgi:hypothetical protein